MAKRMTARWLLVACAGASLATGAAMAGCGGDDTTGGTAVDGGTDATTDAKIPPVDGGTDATGDTTIGDGSPPDSTPGDAADADAGCAPGQTACNGACVDTQTSAANCGACGHACGGALTCANAHCSNEISAVSAGDGFACALKADGSVWCWGSNQMGELGAAPSASDLNCGTAHCNTVPQKIPTITDAVQLATGRELACVIRADRSVWCWGKNDLAQLGHPAGTGTDKQCDDLSAPPLADGGVLSVGCNAAPQQITFPAGVKIAQISVGPSLVCARTEVTVLDAGGSAGDVYCWGNNGHDTVGLPPDAGDAVPTPNKISVFASDVIDVRIGGDTRFACGVRIDGTVWCWGDDFQGRIGIPEGTGGFCGGNQCLVSPSQVRVQAAADADAGDIGLGAPLTNVRALGLGDGTACALKNDGTIWCWGNNELASLGDNGPYDVSQHPGARQVPALPATMKRVIRTARTTLAVDGTGAAWAWGNNSFGDVGNGTVTGVICPSGGDAGACVAPPAKVPGLAGSLDLATGVTTGVLVKPDFTVWAWGRNDRAQLGHAPTTAGDVTCTSGPGLANTAPCNPSPSKVTIP